MELASDDGRPKYKFHSLRHAAASLFIKHLQPKQVQYIMGHASITVTYDIYGHLFKNHVESVRLALDKIELDLSQ